MKKLKKNNQIRKIGIVWMRNKLNVCRGFITIELVCGCWHREIAGQNNNDNNSENNNITDKINYDIII